MNQNTFLKTIRTFFLGKEKTDFERVFSYLKNFEKEEQTKVYKYLKNLNRQSSETDFFEISKEIQSLKITTNTNSFFYFFFPIVSHVLHFKPELESDLLNFLIGPNFANGANQVDEMIDLIQAAVEFKKRRNPFYLSKESQLWVSNSLPKLRKEVQREIDRCWEDLNE